MSADGHPIFRQIIDWFDKKIETGEYVRGQLVPSEPELCKQFSTTRMTVRRAIDALVNEGKLYRIQGRGTYISQIEFEKLYKKHGFTSNMIALGKVPSSTVLYAGECDSVPVIRNHLEVEQGEPLFCLRRVRLADGEPIAIENVWLPLKRFPRLKSFDFSDKSLYEILHSEFGMDLSSGYSKQRISAVTVSGEDAQILFGTKRGVALRIRNVDYDKAQRPFAATEALYHNAKYTLDIVI
jgi:GntR family transcriptional regulator